jgi:hypothetical protein
LDYTWRYVMRYLLRDSLLVLAVVLCQFAQGQPLRESQFQGDRPVRGTWVEGEDVKANASTRTLSLPSPFHVIDTALVLTPEGDTLRNVYTFNARAKRILDLEQRLASDEWVNRQRL